MSEAHDSDYDYDDDEHENTEPAVNVTVVITGLSLYTHHGVEKAERDTGQRISIDVEFDIGEADALVTDRISDTIDYAAVCQELALVAQQRSYNTLERLAAVMAERLSEKFGATSVTVRIAKPSPPLALPVEEVAVELWREGP